MEYNKLVRDYIPIIIADSGKSVKFKALTNEEYRQALNDKLLEEVNEYLAAETGEGKAEELADIREVLEEIINEYQIENDVHKIQCMKKANKGGFNKGYFLISVEDKE